MKINEVIVEQRTSVNPQLAKIAEIGRRLMDMATKHKDDLEANQMANLGNVLGDFGEPFGPKNLMDVVKMTGLDATVIKKLMAMAQQVGEDWASDAMDSFARDAHGGPGRGTYSYHKKSNTWTAKDADGAIKSFNGEKAAKRWAAKKPTY